MNAMRSAVLKIEVRSCETTMHVTCLRLFQLANQGIHAASRDGIQPGGGLVKQQALGLWCQGRAMATRLRIPSDNAAEGGSELAHVMRDRGTPRPARAPHADSAGGAFPVATRRCPAPTAVEQRQC